MAAVVTPSEGLERLRAAAGSGELHALYQRRHVTLRTVFGSAGRGEPDQRDLKYDRAVAEFTSPQLDDLQRTD